MPRAIATPYGVLQRARCALCINKIGLVELDGEHGSRIHEDIRTLILSNDGRGRQSVTAQVYEGSNYRLSVQLDCGGQLSSDLADSPCSRSLSIAVWIDYNDNNYNDEQSQLLIRSWSPNDAPTGIYSLDIRVPGIDNSVTKRGPHRMTLTVTPSDEYVRECGAFPYQETRQYTIDVLPRQIYVRK